jgi:dipeptidyl aminopeptidase/acylaminoacyl peptidase
MMIFVGCSKQSYKTEIIPINEFFKNPQNTQFELSPDGNNIAYLKPWKNRLNIFAKNLSTKVETQLTNEENSDIQKIFWANKSTIIYSIDKYGNDNNSLISISIDTKQKNQLNDSKNANAFVINLLPEFENEIIIETNERDATLFDVYRINLLTGNREIIGHNPGNITHWLTDNNGKLRVAVTTNGVNNGILYRDDENGSFKEIKNVPFSDFFFPIAFSADNKYVYVLSNEKSDRTALIKYDIKKNYEVELIYEHPEVDIEHVFISARTKNLLGVSFLSWKREFHFWDARRSEIQQKLESKMPNMEIEEVGSDYDENKYLLKISSDKSYGSYYLYDSALDSLEVISEISPWLKDSEFSQMKPISFKSQDGLTINGYLTLPKVEVVKNLPVVVLPHGGPWLRDKWEFNKTVQFLANRGYVVLQINYRGSVGYGKEFWMAGFRQWGGKMQDDIIDGVSWLVKQGFVDESKIAIMGSSFGGYLALHSLTKNPDIFACGISQSGISNLISFLDKIPQTWTPFRKMLNEMIGDPIIDSTMLKSYSPFFNYQKIAAPLLIAHGKNDSKIEITQVNDFVSKLKDNKIDVKYIVNDNEGHIFSKEENRIAFYREVETFLAKHLKGRKEK